MFRIKMFHSTTNYDIGRPRKILFLQKLSHLVFLNDITYFRLRTMAAYVKSSFLLRRGASTGTKNRSTVFITGIVIKFYNRYRILWEVTVYLPVFCRGTWNHAKT